MLEEFQRKVPSLEFKQEDNNIDNDPSELEISCKNDDSKVKEEVSSTPSASEFQCRLCPCSRKSRFRLLQHYSAAHFRDQLEMEHGHQFLPDREQCGLCGRKMKNRLFFTLHIGAVHQKVVQFLQEVQNVTPPAEERQNRFSLHCSFPACSDSLFPNKSSLLKHLSVKHFSKQLTSLLKPMFVASHQCGECGKESSTFQNYMMHSAITHKLVLDYYEDTQDPVFSPKPPSKEYSELCTPQNMLKIVVKKCSVCQEDFDSEHSWLQHYTMKHFYSQLAEVHKTAVAEARCSFCNFISGNPLEMVEHIGVHHEKVFEVMELNE